MVDAEPSTGKTPNKGDKKEDDKEPIEYNPRYSGYSAIILTSLVNFSSVASVPGELRAEEWYMAIAFGALTFTVASLILIQDRTQSFVKVFHYMKAKDGKFEGTVLLFMTLWWVIGVAYITAPAGIAYVSSNIYFSSWLSFFSCAYTLNLWGTDKDILSFAEITSISQTLKGWWVHFISATVVFASSIHLHIQLRGFDDQDTSFAIALGLVSMAVSFIYILIHYDFLNACGCEEGGWTELWTSCFLIMVWIVGLAVLTQQGSIAATIDGNECLGLFDFPNCTVVVALEDASGAVTIVSIPCSEKGRQVPGSNLYFACWFCMLSMVYVVLRWKAAQAMKFAQAREEQQQKQLEGVDRGDSDIDRDNDDDDDGIYGEEDDL